jgi:hypothetical protein
MCFLPEGLDKKCEMRGDHGLVGATGVVKNLVVMRLGTIDLQQKRKI